MKYYKKKHRGVVINTFELLKAIFDMSIATVELIFISLWLLYEIVKDAKKPPNAGFVLLNVFLMAVLIKGTVLNCVYALTGHFSHATPFIVF